MLLLRSLFFMLLLPGVVTVLLPYLLLGNPREAHGRVIPALQLAGLPALLLGVPILLWCIWQFYSEGKGTLAPVDPPRNLVVRGLYRYSRNPMYLGVLLILLGESLWFSSWRIGLELLLFFLLVSLFIRHYEEPALRRQFGAAYEQYAATVGRWLPRRSGKEPAR